MRAGLTATGGILRVELLERKLFPERLCDLALLGVSLNLKLSVYELRNSLATYYFELINPVSSEDLGAVYKHE